MIQIVETWKDGLLVLTEEVEVPDPAANSDVISAVASMTPEEIDQLKQLLGL
jgi:predicted ATP-grasp superfamily ATP-dependent carboligase